MDADGSSTYSPKILVTTRRCLLSRAEWGLYEALKKRFRLRIMCIEDGWPARAGDVSGYDKDYVAWIWHVPFRHLMLKPAFDWGDYRGLRLMLDFDVQQNYSAFDASGAYLGKWPEVFRRNGFHLLISSGRLVRDLMIVDGVPTCWLPKAYSPSRLFDLGRERRGVCHFGAPYLSRQAMLGHLRTRNVRLSTFHCIFEELNDRLNRYLACVICNMTWKYRRKTARYEHRLLRRVFPFWGVALGRGNETMLKNFEVAGAGCAPVADWIDEM